MLADILALIILVVVAYEIRRTIARFGLRRTNMLMTMAQTPGAHVMMALVLGTTAVLLGVSVEAVPLYVAPIGGLISVYYLVAALRFRRQQAQHDRRRQEEREKRSGQRGGQS